jgi:glycosyltransferase involved in cell wall biosynthesis
MERYRTRLVEALREVATEAWAFDVLTCDGSAPWMRSLPSPFQSRLAGLKARWRDYPKLAAARPGSIHHVLDHSHAMLVGSLPPERTVVTCHDIIPLLAARGELDVPIKPWIRTTFAMRLKAMRSAAMVIADSEATRRDLVEKADFDPSKVTTVPLGIEPGFGPEPDTGLSREEEGRVLRRRWKMPEDAKIVLHVGTRNRYKNTPAVLRTFAAVAQEHEDVRLVRLGAGLFDDEGALASALGICDRLVLDGDVDEGTLRAAYRAADVFVFPSLYEGFGWPPLEAMASGTPVVASNAGSLPEVIGDAGFLHDPGDVDGMARTVSGLLSDPVKARLASDAGMRRAAQFSWRRCATRVLEVYEGVVARAEDGAASR